MRPRRGERAADHRLDRGVEVHRPIEAGDVAPAAQHDHAVGERLEVGHAVRDVEDGDAALLQALQGRIQALRLARRQAGRRLVEDQQLGPVREGAGDGDELTVGSGEVGEVAVQRQRKAGLVQHGLGLGTDGPARDEERRTRVDEAVQEQRVGDAEAGDADQVGRLVHGDDAGPCRLGRRPRRVGLILEDDAAAVRRQHAGEDLHERGLAGAVGAHQRDDLARVDREGQVDEGSRGPERSRQFAGLEKRHGSVGMGAQGRGLYEEARGSGGCAPTGSGRDRSITVRHPVPATRQRRPESRHAAEMLLASDPTGSATKPRRRGPAAGSGPASRHVVRGT